MFVGVCCGGYANGESPALVQMVNPFSTKFWASGTIPFHFLEQGESIHTLLEKTERNHVWQIVGPHGSGKSTLLSELGKRYESSGKNVRYLSFNDQHRRLPRDITFQADQTLFIDGFEQLQPIHRVWLQFWAKRLIVTVHRPIWFVSILYRTNPQFSIFVQIVRQITPTPPEESVLRTIYERSSGNFRNAFFELYDMFAEPSES